MGEDRLSCRAAERLQGADEERDGEDVPDLHWSEYRQGREREDDRAARELEPNDKASLVQPVREDAAEEVEDDRGRRAREAGVTEIDRRLSELVDQPTMHHPHRLLAADRRQVTDPEAPVLRVAQRAEDADARPETSGLIAHAHRRSRPLPAEYTGSISVVDGSSPSRSLAAQTLRVNSVGSRRAIWSWEKGRRRSDSSAEIRPSADHGSSTPAPATAPMGSTV